jgi:hypothetical protein
VFLFGHNPGLTDLVNELSEEPIPNVPTCGVVEFRIAGASWSDVRRDTVRRVDFDYPKRLGQLDHPNGGNHGDGSQALGGGPASS